ncbi:amino acid permease [Gordonia insulae]|uniref:Putative amino acid permease YhdG n=1 Tax=Gordonia insulae TaxID=2420509 RepID=A0A3G8JTA2_9ACTN|nr:amino acid permease [Gordonia insulae]AZG48297.1 putative amino acid permease YhdG [Gordonia insulae]
MTQSHSISSTIFRRKPVVGAGAPGSASGDPHLSRSIGTFQLTLFGVGATVGTGIFIVVPEAISKAGPAVLISFIIAGVAAGLAAICYAEMASAVPVSGSSYSYAYATLGEVVAVGIGACLMLEYGVSAAATSIGWGQYLNELINNLFGWSIPHQLAAAPWGVEDPGWVNLPAVILVVLCGLLLVRGASESALVNTVMVLIKIGVLLLFAAVCLTAFTSSHFSPFMPEGMAGVTSAAAVIFFTFIGLDAVSTAGDEVKDPQRAMPRAIIGALVVVVSIYLLTAVASIGAQAWTDFNPEDDASLSRLANTVTGSTWVGTIIAAGAVISIFSVTLVVIYGQTRILFAMGRDGLLPATFSKVSPKTMVPVNNTVIVCAIIGILGGFVPIDKLWDLVSVGTLAAFIVVSIGVVILRRTMPDLPRPFKVPGYPVTPFLSVAACIWILSGLTPITFLFFGIWVGAALIFYFLWGRRHSALNAAEVDETPR